MYVVLINWDGGDNDPFTVFNATLAGYLEACGKLTKTIQLTNNSWPSEILNLKSEGIDFVFTWQGLGTSVLAGPEKKNVWDILQVPLICYHGDHPCRMPSNHALDRSYCAHLYNTSEFSRYANKHFRRVSSTISLPCPVLSTDVRLGSREGDFFVLVKNVTPPAATESRWKRDLPERLFSFYMSAAEMLKYHLTKEPQTDFHAVLDELIVTQCFDELYAEKNVGAHHFFHAQLDGYIRDAKTESVYRKLKDFPVHIFGAGWDSYAASGSKHHRFFSGKTMANSQSLYYSKYGIIDISPSTTGLHDRTLRAMQNETPFLISASMPSFLVNKEKYDSLFYSCIGDDLCDKCEAVMADPDGHTELARNFSHEFQSRVDPSDFVLRLDSVSRSLKHFRV